MESDTFSNKELLASNPNTPLEILYKLYDMGYFRSLVKNPNAPTELLQQIYDNTVSNPEKVRGHYNPNTHILYDIARNPNAPQEVLRTLSVSTDRISGDATIQKAVAQNPSTPVDILEKLDEKDVLQNPNIPIDLMYKIIDSKDRNSYQRDMEEFPSIYTPESISKKKRVNGIEMLNYILVKNPNLSPDILQIIEEKLQSNNHMNNHEVLLDLLKNPNTPSSIIEKYATKIDYDMVLPRDFGAVLYSVVQNPNAPSKVLRNIEAEIDKRGDEANCREAIADLLKNPNTPDEILTEYIQTAMSAGNSFYELDDVLQNPRVFDVLGQKEITKTPLQKKEEELSSLEEEEKKIAKAEKIIEKQTQKEGQDIGEN